MTNYGHYLNTENYSLLSKSKRSIGFFGGSFDPIHLGHLNLAIQLYESHCLDEIWFCPAFLSPHKQNQYPLSGQLRLEMVKLALAEIPTFKVIDTEINREGVSYTIDTLEALGHQSQDQFHLLLGEDSLKDFSTWKDFKKIIEIAPPLIGTRFSSSEEIGFENSPLGEALKKGFTPINRFEISSTNIRERLQNKLYCGHLIPRKVLDFILQNHLYSNGYERF